MLPSPLSNCQEDVDQFLLTLSNISEAAHPPAQVPNPSVSESLPQEALDLLAVTKYTPEKIFSIVDVNIVTYISGYIVWKIRDKLCSVCQQRLESVRARFVPRLMEVAKRAMLECEYGLCNRPPLIVGLFVNIGLHHSLGEATKDITNNKTRRNHKLMKFSHR